MTNPFSRATTDTAPPSSPLERRPPAATGARADRKATRPGALNSDPAVSPFLADHTRGGMTDRFAELNRRRSDWVLVCVGLVACLLVSLGMNAYQAVRTTLIPFKVVVDGDDGYLLDSGPLEPMTDVEGLYIRRELREVVSGLRTVTGDRAATINEFNRAYGRLISESAAQAYVNDYVSRDGGVNSPMTLVGRGQRTVVEFVGPTKLEGTETWTFQWAERTVASGVGVTEDTYKGSMIVDILPVKDLATAEVNPLGVWITGMEWEKVSSKILNPIDLEGGSPLDMLYPELRGRRTAPGAPATGTPPAGTPAPGAAAPAAAPAAATPAPSPAAQ